jgi:peptidoglycan/LPS O-acetylase OafA/YrhL
MPAEATAGNRLDFLDVARGAAALLVVCEHGLHTCVPGYLEFSQDYVILGQTAILVFFMVSGFVIPMSLENGQSNAGFWLRRFFRLFPVYWLSIGLAFACLCAGGGGIGVQLSDTRTWLANLLLLQGCLNCPHVWGVFWTLPYELLIYATCSLLFGCRLLNRVGGRVCIALVVVIALVGVGRPLLAGKPMAIDGMRRVVLFPCLFGLVAHRYAAGQLGRRWLYGLLTSLAATVVLVWAVNHALFPSDVTPGQLGRMACLWGLAFSFFVCLLEARHRRMPKVACWLGRHSYPIYLLHPFVLVLLTPTGWSVWAFLPCLVGFTLLLAALTHRLIERPGIALGRLIEKRLRSATPTAPVLVRRAA